MSGSFHCIENEETKDSISELESTIRAMEHNVCRDPRHGHSFQQASLQLWGSCPVCCKRFQAVWFGSTREAVVRCIACGGLVHRTCSLHWKEKCSVNTTTLTAEEPEDQDDDYVLQETNTYVQKVDALCLDGQPRVEKAAPVADEEPVPLHYANHPFASVSRALQENILAHFHRRKVDPAVVVVDKATLTETKEPAPNQPHPIMRLASGTIDAVRTTAALPQRMGVATVAGGIAGGVAGLAMAGPVGAMAGYRLGQTAGALGVILEGSVSIGVFVASVATGGYTAQQIQDQIHERRILTMGEDGIERKVLLVRPNIQIDPEWARLTNEARLKATKESSTVSSFLQSATSDRHRRDEDIVCAAEDELPTNDKILLLTSRVLNDKTSIPGYVYRSLITTFKDRCRDRESMVVVEEASARVRRDDCHAVIKHVTATLLESRPGLGKSASLIDLTATAVELLVFGELYSWVMEEIVAETAAVDRALLDKMIPNIILDVSKPALQSLLRLPDAHTAVDKLSCCVEFLERISADFEDCVSADSLLKLVCEQIVAARLDHLNAEVAFLEEFARDEQLLRGREGYSLVTLQASLHFLNQSKDLERDVFGQDDEEENIPVEEACLEDD